MKNISKVIIAVFLGVFIITSCNKVADLPLYADGTAPVLSTSKTLVTPALADSNKSVLSFSWTDPKYSNIDSTTKYIIQFDSAGGNFAKALAKEVIGRKTASYTGEELNNILLNLGFAAGTSHNLGIRVISSYGNNNERHNSNIVNVIVSSFIDPSVLRSSASTVTGSAATANQTALTFTWTPSFKGYNGNITYAIEYDSTGNNFSSPQNLFSGSLIFSHDFSYKDMNEAAMNENVVAGTTGKLDFRIKAATLSGVVEYSNKLSININTYIPLIIYTFPQALWVAGNYQGWDPPTAPQIVDAAATGTTGTNYEGYINFSNPATEFKLVKGDNWGAGDFGTGGIAGQLGNAGNLAITTGSGVYLLKANTSALTWSATKIDTWGIIGSATSNGWGSSTPMILNSNGTYTITAALTGGNEMKFRANNDWAINFGDNKSGGGPDNIPDYGGDNIAIATSGNYLITLDLTHGGNYKYSIKKV